MKKINNPVISFVLVLVAINILVAAIHFSVLDKLDLPLFDNRIVLAYIVNVFHAIAMFVLLYALRVKQEHNLGFIYMLGSLVKFGLFFLLFYPLYKTSGEIETVEFATFFTPYGVCLFIETFYLVKLLNAAK